ncbi:MAG: hypothetical protein IJX49_04465 [Clostridia bacterium]|nr:hypothetical protein [Clostridia bacterium]
MFNWFWEFLYGLLKVAFYCIDFILKIAQMLCGIQTVTVTTENGTTKETDILYHFLSSSEITNAFIVVAVVGFVLLFLFTAFAILRAQVKDGEGKTPAHICFNSAKMLLYFFMVPGIMILGCVFVSTIMGVVFQATSLGDGSLGASLFAIIAEEAYDGSGNVQDVLDRFISGELDYYSTHTVQQYFDLSEMNYFLGFVGGVVILILLALSMLSFVDRIISLVVLFVISPLSMSSAALDDGARFKLWRDAVINKFLSAFGALICLNVFVLMLSVVNDIQFFDNNFMNALARLFFTLGGAFACYRGTALVGNLINSGAGSQELADRAFSNGMFGRVAGLAMGGAKAVLGGAWGATKIAAKPVTKPLKMAGSSISKNVSDKIHRNSNAKREAKAMIARDHYMQKYTGKSGAAFPDVREQLLQGGLGGSPQQTEGASGGGGSVATVIQNGGSGSDDSANREAVRKITDSMPDRGSDRNDSDVHSDN